MGWGLPAGHPPRCLWVLARRRCRWHPAGEGGSLRALHPKVTPHRKKPRRTDTDGQTDAAPYRWSRGAGGTPGTDEPPHALGPRTEVLAGGAQPKSPLQKTAGGGFPWAEAPQMCLSWFLVPPPSSWGWGTTEAGPPPWILTGSPGCPRGPGKPSEPWEGQRGAERVPPTPPGPDPSPDPPPSGSSPWLLSPRGCPQVLASPRHPRGRRGGEGTRGRVVAGGDAARWRLPCGLSPLVAPANHRSPGHPTGHKMSPRPPPPKKRGPWASWHPKHLGSGVPRESPGTVCSSATLQEGGVRKG